MNMQSHLWCHQPDLLVERAANVDTVSQPAAVNSMFKAKLPLSPLRAASIMKLIAGFICKDLHRTVWSKMKALTNATNTGAKVCNTEKNSSLW